MTSVNVIDPPPSTTDATHTVLLARVGYGYNLTEIHPSIGFQTLQGQFQRLDKPVGGRFVRGRFEGGMHACVRHPE